MHDFSLDDAVLGRIARQYILSDAENAALRARVAELEKRVEDAKATASSEEVTNDGGA